jgi:hypothetical protein
LWRMSAGTYPRKVRPMPALIPVLMPSSSRRTVLVEKDRRKGRKGRELEFAALTALRMPGGKCRKVSESAGNPDRGRQFVRLLIRSIVAP